MPVNINQTMFSRRPLFHYFPAEVHGHPYNLDTLWYGYRLLAVIHESCLRVSSWNRPPFPRLQISTRSHYFFRDIMNFPHVHDISCTLITLFTHCRNIFGIQTWPLEIKLNLEWVIKSWTLCKLGLLVVKSSVGALIQGRLYRSNGRKWQKLKAQAVYFPSILI